MATTKKSTTSANKPASGKIFTVPGVDTAKGRALAEKLQLRLHALNDLQLTLKHAHWNVVGPKFIGVHTMLDPQVDGVRAMVDELAERMATMGVSPNGCPGDLVAKRTWDDYAIGLGQTAEHLAALDLAYSGVIEDHRTMIDEAEPIDVVTHDMLVGQVAELEKYQWFIRAHLMDSDGALVTEGVESSQEAVKKSMAADIKVD